MKKLLIAIFLFSPVFILFAQDLPHKMTDSEKELMKIYSSPISLDAFTTPPLKSVRTMAEWERLQGILITWTSYQSILKDIVDHAQEEGLVYIVCSDSNTVKNYLTSYSVPLYNLKFLIAPFNSIWCRDYGPWTVYSDDIDSLYLVDWKYNRPRPNDDAIPGVLATYKNYPLYQTTVSPYNLINTGGNFMVDGQGTGFASKLVINENPTQTNASIDTIMKKFMGLKRYIKMDVLPYDEIHHIDMHMKLLDEETILVGQYPQGVADGPQIEANLQYILNNFQTCYGRPYRIVRIPMPPDANGQYPHQGGDYRTYTNSLIVNKTVIIPTYQLQYDSTAFRIYREAMPGYKIVGINSNQIITALGTIHCITKEIGVEEPVVINFPRLLSVEGNTNGYPITAYIKSKSGIASAKLYWSNDTTLGFNQLNMNQFHPDSFRAVIPLQPFGTKLYYYVSAQTNSGIVETKPLTSPSGAYSLIVDSVVPVELISFNAESNGNSVLLKWITATETNNSGFKIERSIDNGKWETIAFISGKGTTTQKTDYIYEDIVTETVINSLAYRLAQIDFDGTVSLSNELSVDLAVVPNNYELYQNYPNPFNPVTVIKYQVPKEGVVSLAVYDMLGNEVTSIINKEQKAGSYEVTFDASSLASGIYFYQLRSGSFRATKKLMLLK